MLRQPVESSNVQAVGYDPGTRILEVEFGKDTAAGYDLNRLYQYLEVPPEIYRALLADDSLGRYVNEVLTLGFTFRFLGTVDEQEPEP
jgi:hypothetical protein